MPNTSPFIICCFLLAWTGSVADAAGQLGTAVPKPGVPPKPLVPRPSPSAPAPPTAPAPPSTPVPDPALSADDLFRADQIQEIALTINSRDWEDLRDKYLENTYYLADLRWRGTTVRNIGIRSRGMGSRSRGKPGLRLDFDRYSTTQEFLGFKSLVLDNLTQDPAMLKERVVMRVFHEVGIPAPRVVHARLTVNNEPLGLYTIVEPIDKKFLKRHLGENDGYLYEFKAADQYGFQHLGSQFERYTKYFEPRTHETASMFDLYRPLVDFTHAISESAPSQFRREVEAFLDVRKFLTHVAVESFVAENDGLLGTMGMNNFYLYRFEDGARFQLLPWDKDSTFQSPEYPTWDRLDMNVLMLRLMEDAEMRAFYLEMLQRCATLAMRPVEGSGEAWLPHQVRTIYDQIRASALADDSKPFDDERFEDESAKVMEFARRRAEYVLGTVAFARSAAGR